MKSGIPRETDIKPHFDRPRIISEKVQPSGRGSFCSQSQHDNTMRVIKGITGSRRSSIDVNLLNVRMNPVVNHQSDCGCSRKQRTAHAAVTAAMSRVTLSVRAVLYERPKRM
jgi:hypothetical protein